MIGRKCRGLGKGQWSGRGTPTDDKQQLLLVRAAKATNNECADNHMPVDDDDNSG